MLRVKSFAPRCPIFQNQTSNHTTKIFKTRHHVFKNRLEPLIKNLTRRPGPPNPNKNMVGVFHNGERLGKHTSRLYYRTPDICNKSAYDPPVLINDYAYDRGEMILEPFSAGKGVVMNRPFALNSFDSQLLPMLAPLVHKYCHIPETSLVTFLKGNRVFSSGTNFIDIYNNGNTEEGIQKSLEFFRLLYTMVHDVHNYESILMPVMDGLTLGSAASFAVNCPATNATPKTEIAWPETSFGFHPDAGALYILSTLHGGIGEWLALTGSRLLGHSVMKAGLASHFIDAETIKSIQKQMDGISVLDMKQAYRYLELASSVTHEPFELQPHLKIIEKCFFKKKSVVEIIKELEDSAPTNDWAKKQLERILQKSPLSLVITYEAFKRTAGLSIDRVLQQDYRLTRRFLESKDFYTGVEHFIINNKKGIPKWEYENVKDVPKSVIDRFFSPFENPDEEFILFGVDQKYNLPNQVQKLQDLYHEAIFGVEGDESEAYAGSLSSLQPPPPLNEILNDKGYESAPEDLDADMGNIGDRPDPIARVFSGSMDVDATLILDSIRSLDTHVLWKAEKPISDTGKWGPATLFDGYQQLKQAFGILEDPVPEKDSIIRGRARKKQPKIKEKEFDLSNITPYTKGDFATRFPMNDEPVSESDNEKILDDMPYSDDFEDTKLNIKKSPRFASPKVPTYKNTGMESDI